MQLRLARLESGEPEIFRSFQGEGPMIGRVRAFIRLSGCNLRCVWCDTAYTWNWREAGFFHERDAPGAPHAFDLRSSMLAMAVQDAAQAILALAAPGLVITGGEPLIQPDAVLALAKAVRAGSRAIALEMETNGTIAPPAELANLLDLIVVSPKLTHAGNAPGAARVPAALAALAGLPQAVFKFVAAQPEDVAEVAQIAAHYAVHPSRIWIMPKGITSAHVLGCGAAICHAALAAGFSYSDRLHIHLFGQARGV